MNKQQRTKHYQQKFHELGQDELFEYMEFVDKDHHKIKCKKCGAVFTRCGDVFKGRSKGIRCLCGNGRILFSKEVDEILSFYAEGHSGAETCEKYNIRRSTLQNWAKLRKVSNGRTFEECNRLRSMGLLPMPSNDKAKEAAANRWSEKLSLLGFELLEWRGKDKYAVLKCKTCDGVFERLPCNLRRGVNCPRCVSEILKLKRETKKTDTEKKKLLKEEEKIRAREEKIREEEQRLDAFHICEMCGNLYTIRDYMQSTGYKYRRNSGVCSAQCRDARIKRKQKESSRRRGAHSEHHYDRAKRLGLPAERGVTLKKLYNRDNGICQICGMLCDYSGNGRGDLYPSIDHIIPMHKGGGHTWNNVQLAHRICNSNKRDYIGEEWNNADGKAS